MHLIVLQCGYFIEKTRCHCPTNLMSTNKIFYFVTTRMEGASKSFCLRLSAGTRKLACALTNPRPRGKIEHVTVLVE